MEVLGRKVTRLRREAIVYLSNVFDGRRLRHLRSFSRVLTERVHSKHQNARRGEQSGVGSPT